MKKTVFCVLVLTGSGLYGESLYRTWTSSTGSTIYAQMSECTTNVVVLCGDGFVKHVRFVDLSKKDQRYVVNVGNPQRIAPADVQKKHAKADKSVNLTDQRTELAIENAVLQQKIKDAEKEIAVEEKRYLELLEQCLSDNPRVGDTGIIWGKQARIDQILSEDSALVTYKYDETSLQVLLKDFQTAGFADGSVIKLPGKYQITGTYKYTTVANATRTVYTMIPCKP